MILAQPEVHPRPEGTLACRKRRIGRAHVFDRCLQGAMPLLHPSQRHRRVRRDFLVEETGQRRLLRWKTADHPLETGRRVMQVGRFSQQVRSGQSQPAGHLFQVDGGRHLGLDSLIGLRKHRLVFHEIVFGQPHQLAVAHDVDISAHRLQRYRLGGVEEFEHPDPGGMVQPANFVAGRKAVIKKLCQRQGVRAATAGRQLAGLLTAFRQAEVDARKQSSFCSIPLSLRGLDRVPAGQHFGIAGDRHLRCISQCQKRCVGRGGRRRRRLRLGQSGTPCRAAHDGETEPGTGNRCVGQLQECCHVGKLGFLRDRGGLSRRRAFPCSTNPGSPAGPS